MKASAHGRDYKSDVRPTTLVGGAPAVSMPASAGTPRAVTPTLELLLLLARAVQQFHTYPPTSPLCQSAIDGCARALVAHEQDRIVFRVVPRELIVEDTPAGRDTIVEHELARRLHAASIAEVAIDRAASRRELSHFCVDLMRCRADAASEATLVDRLAEHGVDRITVRPAYRPEVLAVTAQGNGTAALVESERQRRQELFARGGAVSHLFPPDRGWVRLDPSTPSESVSLVELAVLAEHPARLASMLMRLTDDGEAQPDAESLSRRFSDVAMLFSALEPRLARVMFARLARAVLELDPESRQALLRRTILPGLLDGRVDGMVLRDFPDLELADSLCLLLDLETAAPEVVATALARLELPGERHSAVAPLVQERLDGRTDAPPGEGGLDAHARKLLKVDRDRARSFAEFTSFDLSLDAQTTGALAQIRGAIVAPDSLVASLECLWQLTRLEPNPDAVQAFVDRAATLLERLERENRAAQFGSWLLRFRDLAAAVRESRPDVGDVIATRLAALATAERARRAADLAAVGGDSRAAADAVVRALSPGIAHPLLAIAQARYGDARDTRGRLAVQLLCDHAAILAPALVEMVPTAAPAGHRIVARVLGSAGTGHESALGALLASADEQTVREALRSLARLGTPQAAALVAAQLETADGWIPAAAEETLWHFPAAEAHRQVRALLARRGFVLRRPHAAARLIDRAAQARAATLDPVLVPLIALRFRVWNPALMRVGRKARAAVQR